jgi:hypothetical protein
MPCYHCLFLSVHNISGNRFLLGCNYCGGGGEGPGEGEGDGEGEGEGEGDGGEELARQLANVGKPHTAKMIIATTMSRTAMRTNHRRQFFHHIARFNFTAPS